MLSEKAYKLLITLHGHEEDTDNDGKSLNENAVYSLG
jgi:hypothetical protein